MTPPDQSAREEALDPGRSFIVQAPAGSGKTGLLIQRYLRLLATVGRPEEIVAITFTRKAAAEMAGRVGEALRAAAAGGEPPAAPHARRIWELAQAALARDRERGWALADHPGRLRIQTFDALALALVERLPLLSRIGPVLRPSEDARPLYREAARRTLAMVGARGAGGEEAAALLDHLEARPDRFIDLIAELLPLRDQWGGVVTPHRRDPDRARRALAGAFRSAVEAHLGRLVATAPTGLAGLAPLARYAARNCMAEGRETLIIGLLDLAGLPTTPWEALPLWQAVAELLLTTGGAPRAATGRGVTARIGFPAGKGEAAERKGEMQALLADLADHPHWCDALHRARVFPVAEDLASQWPILDALATVLHLAAAHLLLVFRDSGAVDFAEVGMESSRALGEAEDPSDLLLRLDAEIRHLLVDELQDTSRRQYHLVELLTAGWEAGDGRTLFLVGDPMQSIYRFREAEVALFHRAWEAGRLGSVPLRRLRLGANFRSRPAAVEWVNATFRVLFDDQGEAAPGAVPFAPGVAQRGAAGEVAVHYHPRSAADWAAEADEVVGLCRAARERGEECVVLVAARPHAAAILPALTRAAIPYQTPKLLPLAERPVVEGLTAIARALLSPIDRIAWLALLRAPWCGLTLAELEALCGADREAPLPALVGDPACTARLGAEARERAARLAKVMAAAAGETGRRSLAMAVEGVWVALGGPALATAGEWQEARALLARLDELQAHGPLTAEAIAAGVAELFAPSPPAADGAVVVTTIHQAKGLEFDTVILPGLGRPLRPDTGRLLRWFEGPDGLLVAAKGQGRQEAPTYRFVKGLDAEERAHEARRLLYVATTRARERLHLLGHVTARSDGALAPAPRSLLHLLWPAVGDAFVAGLPPEVAPRPAAPVGHMPVRLERAFRLPESAPPLTAAAPPPVRAEAPPFRWAGEVARHVGTVVHALLQRIAREGLAAWDGLRVTGERSRLAAALAVEGVVPGEVDEATARVVETVVRVLADPRGQWLLAPHPEAVCELPLSGVVDGRTVHCVLDRTFVEHGTRWIVDYKSSTHEGGDADAFLAAEWDRYRPQLERYARLMAGLDARPIRIGLYHPLLGGWRATAP